MFGLKRKRSFFDAFYRILVLAHIFGRGLVFAKDVEYVPIFRPDSIMLTLAIIEFPLGKEMGVDEGIVNIEFDENVRIVLSSSFIFNVFKRNLSEFTLVFIGLTE